jgi:hypothetical protein
MENDFMATLFGRPIPIEYVKVNATCPNVLEIDVAKVWKDSKANPGWSNEVAIQVNIR